MSGAIAKIMETANPAKIKQYMEVVKHAYLLNGINDSITNFTLLNTTEITSRDTDKLFHVLSDNGLSDSFGRKYMYSIEYCVGKFKVYENIVLYEFDKKIYTDMKTRRAECEKIYFCEKMDKIKKLNDSSFQNIL